ncbi:hypothetical protein FKM82_029190 [Ascaphus truei]
MGGDREPAVGEEGGDTDRFTLPAGGSLRLQLETTNPNEGESKRRAAQPFPLPHLPCKASALKQKTERARYRQGGRRSAA